MNSAAAAADVVTRKRLLVGSPHWASNPYTALWEVTGGSGQAPMPCTSIRSRDRRRRMRSRPAGLLPSDFWRRDPDAALRGFAKTRSPARACSALSARKASTGKKISPRTSTSGGCPVPLSLAGIDPIARTFSVTSSPTTPSPRVAALVSRPCS